MTTSPLLCTPQYKERIWGGRNLERVLGRTLPPDANIGESWEVSDVPDSSTPLEGGLVSTLADAIAQGADAVLGMTGYPQPDGTRRFPLLVKYLDANELLSVQVHPGDEYAGVHENGSPGKSEMWLVLDAEDGAAVIAGLAPGVTKADFAAAIREGRVAETLRRRKVTAGDVVLMPAGRLHALGKGIVALEIQQTSDVTYRLYDWDRVGQDGKPRELHVDRGMDVIDFDDDADPVVTPVERQESWGTRWLLGVTPYFVTESLHPSSTVEIAMHEGSPDVLIGVTTGFTIVGNGDALVVPAGRSAVVPAGMKAYRIEPDGAGMVVRSYVPNLAAGLPDWAPRDADESEMIRGVCSHDAAVLLFPAG